MTNYGASTIEESPFSVLVLGLVHVLGLVLDVPSARLGGESTHPQAGTRRTAYGHSHPRWRGAGTDLTEAAPIRRRPAPSLHRFPLVCVREAKNRLNVFFLQKADANVDSDSRSGSASNV